jgi:hypothetical protein
MKRLLKWTAATILILSVSACCTTSDPAKLPIPPAQSYPTIPAEKLKVLDKETMKALVERDTLKTERIQTLEDIIRSTH